MDRAANDAVDTWQNIVDHDGSATSGRDGGAATDTVSRDATNEEGELADSDLLAATEEAEAAHRADEVRTRSGAGPADSVVDGEERGSGEMVSRARRQERIGFGALSLAGTVTLIVVAGQWGRRRWSWRSWRSWSIRRPRWEGRLPSRTRRLTSRELTIV